MDPILEQIYATILPSAPFVIAAYALMLAALIVYVIYATVRMKNVESQIAALRETVEKSSKHAMSASAHDVRPKAATETTHEVHDESDLIKKK